MQEAREAGNIAIPFVRQLRRREARSEAAARSVHLGATSQDVLDTALVLQMREALQLLEAALARLDGALLGQVRRHRDTVMQGRTWLQPGPPTTLGLKLAGTLAALRRDSGAHPLGSGTSCWCCNLAEQWAHWLLWERREAPVSAELARLLNFAEPELPWHAQRDSLAAMVQVLAISDGNTGKVRQGYCAR